MAKRSIKINGWSKSGPGYEVATLRGGWKNRRNRRSVERFGAQIAHSSTLDEPAHYLLEGAALFNQGFVYEAVLLVDAKDTVTATVDATQEYVVFPLPDGIDLLAAEHVVAPDPFQLDADDDEDAPVPDSVQEREVASDEEE